MLFDEDFRSEKAAYNYVKAAKFSNEKASASHYKSSPFDAITFLYQKKESLR